MGLSYSVRMSPSLNQSSVFEAVSQTVWAGNSEVFGGPLPLVLSLATTWSRLTDETKGSNFQGFILSPAGTSPGSTLNNETFLSTTDRTFRASILLNRGTTFLNILVTYTTSLALLIGAIFGYFGVISAAGAVLMRTVEALHQGDEDPPSVKRYLRSISSSDNMKNLVAMTVVKTDPVEL